MNFVYENIANTQVGVYDIFGQLIMSKRNCNLIDLTAYSDGLYLFVVTDLEKQLSFSRMVVFEK